MTATALFPPAGAALRAGLQDLPRLLDEVAPLASRHRARLPAEVADLSRLLTVDRPDLPPDYLCRPGPLAAYVRYYLPWNLLRQGRLLAGLAADLDLPPQARILDVGAGPLTFLLALWFGRPELRERPLRYLGIDRAEPALRLGRALAASAGAGSAWGIETAGAPAGRLPRSEPADLLVLANVLNEWPGIGPGRGARARVQQEDPLGRLVESWRARLRPGGRVLVIEPGVRGGGRLLARVRETALGDGWTALAPCPHQQMCPLPGTRGAAWCHFNLDVRDAPAWLLEASRRAGLPKEHASLSFLLLQAPDAAPGAAQGAAPGDGSQHAGTAGTLPVRVVSERFPLAEGGSGRYGCCERGLVVLRGPRAAAGGGDPLQAPPGSLVAALWPRAPRRDQKSGATIVGLEPAAGRRGTATGRGPGGRPAGPPPSRRTPRRR